MRLSSIPAPYLLAGGALLLVVGYVYFRGIKGVASDVASGAVNATAGAVEGTVLTIGDAVGLPRTDEQLCELACADGRTGDASTYCSLVRFGRYLATGS